MCHTSPLGRMSVAALGEVDGADKAGLSGRNQSQMRSGPRHGGPTTSAASGGGGGREGGREERGGGGATAGWPLTQSGEPRAKADSCHGRGRRPAIISFTHMVYERAGTFWGEPSSARLLFKCLQFICCKFFFSLSLSFPGSDLLKVTPKIKYLPPDRWDVSNHKLF